MERTCPSCRRPLTEKNTESDSLDTAAIDSTNVCALCGLPLSSDLTAHTAEAIDDPQQTAFELSDLNAGQNQVAHFQLRQLLGRGGFGAVWLAEDLHLGRLVALKLPKSTRKDAKLLHEAKTAAKLKHPHIVSIFEVGVTQDQIFIASEYIDGSSLRERITEGRLPVGMAISLLITVARAVAHANKSDVIHRDLKPENILLDSEDRPFITDFGVAKQLSESETISTDGQVLGTISYMSPEQAEGNTRATDQRSDVYALGTILFELLTEYRPFRGNSRGIIRQKLYEDPPSPRKLVPNLARDLETICLKCLQREPGKRYQTADELADELDRFQNGNPILARPISRTEMLWRWCKRNQMIAGLVVGVFFSLSLGLIGISYFGIQSARSSRLRQEALYRTHMVLISNLWQNGDIKSLKQILSKYERGDESKLRDYEWFYYTHAMKPYLQIIDHGDSVVGVAISNDGELFASAGRDRVIKVWRQDTGEVLRVLRAGAGDIASLEFSPTDERLISTHSDGTARLWNPQQHDREVRRYAHGPGLVCARFEPSGRTLFTVGTRGEVRRWNVASGEQVDEQMEFGRGLSDLCIAENGHWAAVSTQSGKITVWDFETDAIVHQLNLGSTVSRLTFADHDQSLVSIGRSNSIHFISLEDESTNALAYDGNVIGDLDYLRGWDELAVVSSSASMRILDSNHRETERLATHALSPGVLDHSEGGRKLVVGGGDGTVKVLDIDRLQSPQVLWHGTHIRDVVFIDREHVATCLGDGSVHRWNVNSAEHDEIIRPTGREMLAIALAPDRQSLFLSGMQPAIAQYDWRSGQERTARTAKISGLAALSISQDGQLLATGSRSGAVLVWKMTEKQQSGAEPFFEVSRAEAQVLDLTFAAASNQLAVAYSDNRVILYDVESRQIDREFELLAMPQSILFSESGDVCFVGTRSGELNVINIGEGSIKSIDAHQGRINALALFPGGQRLISAGRDQTINIWDVPSLERVGILRGHERQVFALAVSPDGDLIASAGLAGDLRLWRTHSP